MKPEQKIIGVAITPEVLEELNKTNYNKSKLVNSLLTEHFKKENEEKDENNEK